MSGPAAGEVWLERVLSAPSILFSLAKNSKSFYHTKYPSFDLPGVPESDPFAVVVRSLPVEAKFSVGAIHTDRDDFGVIVAAHLASQIYFFNAKRIALGRCSTGAERELNSDSSNLGEVIQNLQEDGARFSRYKQLVNRVMPTVRDVSARNVSSGIIELMVSSYPPEADRPDLFVNLDHCGSGVSQVLAILYVLISSRDSRVLIIDEPNSYLHPGAIRQLLEVAKDFRQHQYILATHSPEVISAFEPDRLILTQWKDTHTEITASDDGASGARAALAEVGARLSDVFGMDRVLWVEGPTEERCLPEIIKARIGCSLVGTGIIGVPATGDLHSRRRQLVYDIYRKLRATSVLLPTCIGMLFDRESLSDKELERLSTESQGLIHFLPRRQFENYLLHVPAIVSVLNAEKSDRDEATLQQVNQWKTEHGGDERYFSPLPVRSFDTNGWRNTVNAAKLMDQLFWDLRTVVYVKARHSFELMRIVLSETPEEFEDLVLLLNNCLQRPDHQHVVAD
jgi:hypothetical protein